MGELTVHVEDDEGNPVARTRVRCTYPGPLSIDEFGEEETDEDGTAYFTDVPVCVVTVRADGRETRVGVGAGEAKDVTLTI